MPLTNKNPFGRTTMARAFEVLKLLELSQTLKQIPTKGFYL